MEELAQSIRTFGLIQPITVRKKADGHYQIISGERRFRACSMTGMDLIPAYVREADDQGMLEMAIVENVQRSDLDPIEVALSYRRLIEECDLTQEQMASRVGKSRVSVTNYLRLLRLPARSCGSPPPRLQPVRKRFRSRITAFWSTSANISTAASA